MTALTRPQGPLPPRVYWQRRLAVLGIATLLIVGIARLLGGVSDGSSTQTEKVRQAAQLAGQPSAAPISGPSTTVGALPGKKGKKKAKKAPPTPSGPCDSADVTIEALVEKAHGGADIVIDLSLRSTELAACTFTVSPDTVTAQITSGNDNIWTSRECRKSIPATDITVYRKLDAIVPLTWSGRRSDATCSNQALWAEPGTYHIAVSAYAGEPTDTRFTLLGPKPVVITRKPTPTPQAKPRPNKSTSPSGAVEPDQSH